MVGLQVNASDLNRMSGTIALNLKDGYDRASYINDWLLANPVTTLVSVSSITRSGAVATVTTAVAHGYATGDWRTIAGATQPEYNGTFQVTVTGTTTFTFAVSGTPATPATGTVTVGTDPLVITPFSLSGSDATTMRTAMADLAYQRTQAFGSSAAVKKLYGLGAQPTFV